MQIRKLLSPEAIDRKIFSFFFSARSSGNADAFVSFLEQDGSFTLLVNVNDGVVENSGRRALICSYGTTQTVDPKT